jgi:hypothetical protein
MLWFGKGGKLVISIEKRKGVFQRYFIDFQSQKTICTELDLSKGSVTKLIKEFRERIAELGLLLEPDLSIHIHEIVKEPIRKKRELKRYLVTDKVEKIIKGLVISNERNRILYGRAGAKSILGLYEDFKKYIERYNYIVYRMDTLASYMSQLSENDKKYIDYLDEYNESYDRYLELSIEFDLPVETEISSKSRIYAFSHETFYRVVKEFKKNM